MALALLLLVLFCVNNRDVCFSWCSWLSLPSQLPIVKMIGANENTLNVDRALHIPILEA